MSGTFKFKRIYSEGVAAEHPDIAGQKEFASKADAEIARRRAARAKKVSPELPSFVKRLKKEEVELGERYKPLPIDKMTNKIESKRKNNKMSPKVFIHKPFVQSLGDVIRKSDNIDKITKTINTHDSLESRFKELENRDRGEKKSKTKLEKDYGLSSDGKYRRRSKVKEEVELGEKIDVGADAGTTISDFVHSKSKTFKGDSKKQRIKRALGAYYAAQKEETENIYDYVIEALVDADFAQDYETAENMFEHMSDEFVAVILEDYIEEAKRSRTERRAANAGKKGYDAKGNSTSRVSKTHVIHDVDDNVADQRHPNAAKIDVMRNNNKTKSLTPGEFAHHKLESGDKYGFNAFRDTDKFKKTTKKTKVAKMGDSPRRPAKKSVVTARGGSEFGSNKPSTPMDKPGSFVSDLKDRIGVKGLERKDTHFTGGMNKGSNKGLSGPEKKAKVVSKIVKPSDKKIITTDDHLGNTRAMAAAASAAAPQSKVKAYQSRPSTKKPKGKGKVGDIVPSRVGKENKPGDTNIGIRANTNPSKSTKETQQRRQRARRGMGEEMTSYDYWKQFID